MNKIATLSRAIQRARGHKMGFPKVPTTWENMIVPNNLSITRDELPFLLKEIHIGEDRAEKVIIFSSAAQQNLLDKSDVWICDGTFDIAQQTMFTQVFIISAKSATGVFVPSLFALLPTKETAAYRLVFNAIKEAGVSSPACLNVDFEKAIINAFQSEFGKKSEIIGCDSHFKRALTRRSQQCGLKDWVKESLSLQTFYRFLWALALVPPVDIVPIWEEFINEEYERRSNQGDFDDFSEELTEFMKYFEDTWIGQLNRRSWNWRRPRYEFQWWNKYNSILQDRDVTSNSIEGYNNAINFSVPRRANVWMVIDVFKTEEAAGKKKLLDAAIGAGQPEQGKTRSKVREQKHKERKNLVQNYHSMDRKMFMYAVIDYYNTN